MPISKKYAVIGVVCIAVLAVSAIVLRRSDNMSAHDPAGYKQVESFKLKHEDGRIFELSSLKGKWVVLHFWAAWCEPCLDEIPKFRSFASKLNVKAKNRFSFVAISLDETWSEAKSIWGNIDSSRGDLLLDPEMESAKKLGSFEYPETYILDPELKVRAKWIGPQNWDQSEVSLIFEKLLNED